MTTQRHTPGGYGDLTSADLHAIVQRAHRERQQTIRDFFAWLFSSSGPQGGHRERGRRVDAVACSQFH
jgi:hypothetical protein